MIPDYYHRVSKYEQRLANANCAGNVNSSYEIGHEMGCVGLMTSKKKNVKKSILKSGFVWAVVFILAGASAQKTDGSIGSVAIVIGIIVLIATVIRHIANKLKNSKASRDTASTLYDVSAPAQRTMIKTENHRVAGVSYRQDAIRSLGTINPDYWLSTAEAKEQYTLNERVYEYIFSPAIKPKLVYEPDNPHGSNAIRVEAEGVHIGYIKSGSATHVHRLMDSGLISDMRIEICGGRYKILLESEDEEDGYEIVRDTTSVIWAKLTLFVRQNETDTNQQENTECVND